MRVVIKAMCIFYLQGENGRWLSIPGIRAIVIIFLHLS